MQKYITQLVADLEAAKANVPPKPNVKVLYPDHPALDYGLDYIAEWECAPSVPADGLFGLDANVFPDTSKLNDEQLTQLVDAILDLWAAYNFDTVFPNNVPVSLVYTHLVKKWRDNTFHYVSEGWTTLEFCSYDCENCTWGEEYCSCKDFVNDYDPEKYKMTPEQEAEWNKGLKYREKGGTGWVNPKLLDDDGNFDSSKLDDLMKDDSDDLPF